MRKITLIILTMLLLFAVTSFAAVPHLINYQGRLTDSTGKPVSDGVYSVTFKLYDNSTGTSPLWTETQSITAQRGVFNVLIGGATTGGISLAFDKQYYLGIQVGSDAEMRPLQQLASSAYAFRAENADNATQAQNATKVNNIEASTTPTANKLLPLDANGKLPTSTLGLKTYDSGWFPVSVSNTYTKTHNLGTTKIMIMVYYSDTPDGSGRVGCGLDTYVADHSRSTCLVGLTTTNVSIRTGSSTIFDQVDSNGNIWYSASTCYIRIVMLALE